MRKKAKVVKVDEVKPVVKVKTESKSDKAWRKEANFYVGVSNLLANRAKKIFSKLEGNS